MDLVYPTELGLQTLHILSVGEKLHRNYELELKNATPGSPLLVPSSVIVPLATKIARSRTNDNLYQDPLSPPRSPGPVQHSLQAHLAPVSQNLWVNVSVPGSTLRDGASGAARFNHGYPRLCEAGLGSGLGTKHIQLINPLKNSETTTEVQSIFQTLRSTSCFCLSMLFLLLCICARQGKSDRNQMEGR